MSFLENRSDISIANKSLSRIGQVGLSGTLDNPVGNSNAARECRLHYKPTVRWVLEQHHWNLATKRQTLVEVTNTRLIEWGFAYAKPSDMAFPVGIYTPGDATVAGPISYYRGLKGLMAQLYGKPLFTYSGGVIYSFMGPAELEFTSFDITEQDFTEQLESVIVLFLAAKLAYSVAKNHDMGNAIRQEAFSELDRIIAANLNEQQPVYGNTMSEAEMARNGWDPWVGSFGPRY